MDTRKSVKWMLLGLGAGTAAGLFVHSKSGRKKMDALAKGTRRALDKAAREGKRVREEEAELLKTATT